MQNDMRRILVIRGGAIGDFILTLPALKVLRDAYPRAHIEILGYKHIAVLVENRFYAQVVRSIEYGPLSSFFAKNSELPPELANYFGSFDLIISYLYDPDEIFENNLRQCGVERLIRGPATIDEREHASRQLARPLKDDLPSRSSCFIPAAEVKRRIGRSKIGSTSAITCLARIIFEDRWSLFRAKQTKIERNSFERL